MSAVLSKEVTDRMRECRFVLSAFTTDGRHVGEALTGLTEPNLEETDETPGYSGVIVGLSRNMQAALDRLTSADADVSAAAAWESALRDEHREKSEQLGFGIVGFRRTVLGQFVAPDMENLALQPVDARDPITVARRSQLIGERFEAPNVATLLGDARFGEPADVAPMVQQIATSSEELLELNRQINEATRVTARARVRKSERMDEYDKLFLRSTRVFEDLCRVAGEDKLADKIRAASVRSRSRQTTEDETPVDVDDTVDDVAEPSDPSAAPEPLGEETSQEV